MIFNCMSANLVINCIGVCDPQPRNQSVSISLTESLAHKSCELSDMINDVFLLLLL